jgi:hypothetical protein
LGEVSQIANNRVTIEVQVEGRSVLEFMEWHGHLGWHWLDICACEIDVLDNGIDECTLCEHVGPITHLLDVDANIVSWMPLVFDFEPSPMNFLNELLQLVVVLA